MRDFKTHLTSCKGSGIKARKSYMRERRWNDEDWFSAWPAGLNAEVEAAFRGIVPA